VAQPHGFRQGRRGENPWRSGGLRDDVTVLGFVRQIRARLVESGRKLKYVLRGSEHPDFCWVSGPNSETIEFLETTAAEVVAEVGTYQGHTAELIARFLDGRGELHLFDFDERVNSVAAKLEALGYRNVVPHASSHRTFDSYNWSLMKLVRDHPEPIFDYVLLDGAHSWHHDGFAFLLLDRLLKRGGYMDFDDHGWTLDRSPTMNPRAFPATRKLYTEEQIETAQVGLIIDLLVRRDERYEEIVENKIFRKMRSH
jgi:predicted O-methyltransferase YrrM